MKKPAVFIGSSHEGLDAARKVMVQLSDVADVTLWTDGVFPPTQGFLQSLKKYEIIIFWSSKDNAYVAEVPELAGCMADGKTYQEALSNAEQIIEEWIETATKLGRPIPQPRGRLAYA